MAFQSIWFSTKLPENVLDLVEKDLNDELGFQMIDSRLSGEVINRKKRNSKNAWVDSRHWIGGLVWHYINMANQQNFLFDINKIDNNNLQYTRYDEGDFYGWHHDAWLESMYTPQANPHVRNVDEKVNDFAHIVVEEVRKLSFILQLTPHDQYEGGNVQLLDDTDSTYFIPRERGTIIVFDSRTKHRVLKVTKGCRKSLVGWAVGPRWK